MDLQNDFKELLELLNDHEVDYLIVGATTPQRGSNMKAQGNALVIRFYHHHSPERAKQLFSRIDFRSPLQGCGLLSHSFPGRCPGLA